MSDVFDLGEDEFQAAWDSLEMANGARDALARPCAVGRAITSAIGTGGEALDWSAPCERELRPALVVHVQGGDTLGICQHHTAEFLGAVGLGQWATLNGKEPQ